LDWIRIDEPSEDNAAQYLDFTAEIKGPVIKGRQIQPYDLDGKGWFQVKIVLKPAFGNIGYSDNLECPDIKFLTKIWHPFVDADSNLMCIDALKEVWPLYFPEPAIFEKEKDKQPMLSVFRMIRGVMENVHESGNRESNVNSEATVGLADGGIAFDKKAHEITKRYAVEM